MSQNSHTLLLFFDNKELFKNCLGMFKHLDADEPEKAAEYSQAIGVDISSAWNDDWFNRQITPTSKYVRLDYDTSTGYDLPLDVLQQFFDAGLRAACLEVFYDQVGEYGQFHFRDGELVNKETVYNKYPPIKAITEELFTSSDMELENDGLPRPATIKNLIKRKAKQEKQGEEMMEAMINLAKVSQESGSSPTEILKAAMILSGIKKGLLQAIGFGIVTVLLFKGMWLWITLAVALALALPVVYAMQANSEFDDDEDSDNNDEEQEEGEAAC
jgi:hypothetical protein